MQGKSEKGNSTRNGGGLLRDKPCRVATKIEKPVAREKRGRKKKCVGPQSGTIPKKKVSIAQQTSKKKLRGESGEELEKADRRGLPAGYYDLPHDGKKRPENTARQSAGKAGGGGKGGG